MAHETEDDRLDGLLADALERLETGGPAAVEELLAAHSDEAPRLRERLSALHAMGFARESDDELPERLGDFRLLERLGGGGMGVVYLAEQESLGRRVALKLVRPELLFFPGARERFKREVTAVARLSDPGIVPVYSVGEERGVPYFAMEHVAGATLAEVIEALAGREPSALAASDLRDTVTRLVARRRGAEDARPASPRASDTAERLFAGSWPSACLRLVAQAALALQHAHERGVLHRDLKPSNLLLTPEGRVLLFDFGLATSGEGQRITRSGARVGSLAYMPPEQLDGRAGEIDERSDVYSLGATLYELLTLQLPFPEPDGEALAAAIRAGRPASPRTLNAAVPRDAETVCLTAMDRDRARRYPSAQALADDLRNVLELRPVSARRPGPWLRTRRFVQRHPAGSTALALGALLVIGGPLGWALQQRRAAQRVQAALDRADANLGRALAAVEALLLRVGDQRLRNVPQADEVRRELVDEAQRFYAEFLAENAGDRRLARDALSAGLRLALLQAELGDAQASLATARESKQLAEELLVEAPDDVELLLQLGTAESDVFSAAELLGDRELARAAIERAEAVARRALELQPDHSSAWGLLAATLDRTSRLARADGDTEAAESQLREAVELQERAVAVRPDRAQISYLSQFANNLATFLSSTGRLSEARELLERVVEVNTEALGIDPDERMAALALLSARANLGQIAYTEKRFADGETELLAAVALGEDLHARFPSDREVRKALASTLALLASTCTALGRPDEARPAHARSVALQEAMLTETPDQPQAQLDLASSLNNLGSTCLELGQAEEAVAPLERGLELMARVRAALPEDGGRDLLHRTLFHHLSKAHLARGDAPAVRATAEDLAATLPGGDCQRIAAAMCSLALRVIAADATLSPEAREAALAECARRAVELAKHAREIGGVSDKSLARAPDFGPLRERPEFAELGVVLEAAASP